MKFSSHRTSAAVIGLLAILLLAGCESFDSFIAGIELQSPQTKTFPAMENNADVVLDAGTYHGVAITYNSVSIRGQGRGRTIIEGEVVITGNNVTLRDVTIKGSVLIQGNNADLRGATIEGKVNSRGNNNRW